MIPDRESGLRDGAYFLLGSGPEEIQSGLASSLRAPGKLGSAPSRARTDSDVQQEYWYGYPAITLPSQGGNGRRRAEVRVAPLLIQQMELAPDGDGQETLRPSGVPSLHTGLITELLSEEEAADLISRWQPTWQEGNAAQMLRAVRELLAELSLPELEPLDLSALSGRTLAQALRRGAHNTAMLLVPSGVHKIATQALTQNLWDMSSRTPQIAGTALDELLSRGYVADSAEAPVVVAPGPCNESQERVITSAMTRPLTVATGPPGTGKSEVVTAVVTTCVAAGQTVLVASTNNEAVDVVAERCDDIAPGLLMRTGNAQVREREAVKLEQLLSGPPRPPQRSAATVAGDLRNVHTRAAVHRQEAARHVIEEERLLELLQERERRATDLGLSPALLLGIWRGGDAALERWEHRARKALKARWFGSWRRARALTAFAAAADSAELPRWVTERPPVPERLDALAAAVTVEREVRELAPRNLTRNEETLKRDRLSSATDVSRLSAEVARAVSAERLLQARPLMNERLQALRRRSGFQKSQKNLMTHIKGWAISTHSVRQLELKPKLFDLVVIDEASQCSIPSVLPLLFRARRALIIGDPMQLGHIPGITPQQERQARVSAGLSAAQLEDHRLAYHVYSAYHAAAQHDEETLLLDEHYRCHPQIADVVNGYCYAGRLRVLTDVRRQVPALDPIGLSAPAPILGWVDVSYGQSARGPGGISWLNSGEVTRVREVVEDLLARLPADATVGVVTPFKAQRDALAKVLRDDRVRVGTVHTFQGGQRDVMVLSPVATANTPPETTHWVASQVNLWNVAITRARSQLITVGSLAFWQGWVGLPTRLAERSVVLGSGDDFPVPPAAESEPSRLREELADRLQRHLGARGLTDLERTAAVGGHAVDLLFTVDGENTAVLIDTGRRYGEDPARHLRLAHAREDLLPGLLSGGRGAKPGAVRRVIRVPAWRILAGDDALGPLFP
jgi:hypothetical protein